MEQRTLVTSDDQLVVGCTFEMKSCQVCSGTHRYRVVSRVRIEDSAVGLDPFGIVTMAKRHAVWGFKVTPPVCVPEGFPTDTLISFGPAIKWRLITLITGDA